MSFGTNFIQFNDFAYCSLFEEEINSPLFKTYLKKNIQFFNIPNNRFFSAGNLEKKLKKYEELSERHSISFLLHGMNGSEGENFVNEGGSFFIKKGKSHQIGERFSFERLLPKHLEVYKDQFELQKNTKGIKLNQNFFNA